jgi:hypothetical protein
MIIDGGDASEDAVGDDGLVLKPLTTMQLLLLSWRTSNQSSCIVRIRNWNA